MTVTAHPAEPEPLADELPYGYREIAGELAADLEKAADVVTKRGLYKGYFIDPHHDRDNSTVDARGAINDAVNEDPEECGPAGGRADRVSLALIDRMGLVDGIDHDDQQGIVTILADWSDNPARTETDVAGAMRACADGLRAVAVRAAQQDAEQG